MSRFRFRAQAALDLRQRELEQAQRELARVEALRAAARGALAAADAEAQRARHAAGEAQRAGGSIAGLEWYRFWIVRLDHERRTCAAALAAREQDVARASAACRHAHQRRESLDRFKQKARAAHEATQQAAEMKLIDELATRRYAVVRR